MTLELSEWPGGMEPVWAMLDPKSAHALRNEPSAENRALRLVSGLTEEELALSAFIRSVCPETIRPFVKIGIQNDNVS